MGHYQLVKKINRLIEVEQRNEKRYKDYFLDKYRKSANEGMCPCCGEEEETVKHLFVECNNESIIEMSVRNKGRGEERQLLWYNRNVYLTKMAAFGCTSFYKTKGHSPFIQ
jgi:hypothetical protein